MSKKALIILVAVLMFLSFSSKAEAQLCRSSNFYNALAWTWEYAGPCTPNYNCLAYSLGITNSWVWPWGSNNPTNNQVTSYMATKGYTTSGTQSKIISYGSASAIVHFSKVTGGSTCVAKCGALNLLKHYSWDPYNPSGSYAPKVTVYKTGGLIVSVSGPTKGYNNSTYNWCANVSGGTPPYTFEWFAESGGVLTTQCISKQMPNNMHLSLMLTVRDANGAYKTVSHFVQNMDANRKAGRKSANKVDTNLRNNLSEMQFNLKDSAFSSNPYDYTNNSGFRKIVRMGPVALESIERNILEEGKNGLHQYLLAIAAEKIAIVDLKTQSTKWSDSREWVLSWNRFLRTLPEKVDAIIMSEIPSEEKNIKLEALGLAALPLLKDRIKQGNTALSVPFNNIINRIGSTPTKGKQQRASSEESIINTFRKLINKNKK